MSQLTIQLSDRADSLIAQLQKEIFNRRRKKVTAAGVVETLVESGAKSQSDKRFATSWTNLIADIEKAAKLADAHGAKPSSLSDEEWALVLSHRTRNPRTAASKTSTPKAPAAPTKTKASVLKQPTSKPSARKPSARKPSPPKVAKAEASTKAATKRTSPSVAKRMAKAVSRLSTVTPPTVPSGNGAVKQTVSV